MRPELEARASRFCHSQHVLALVIMAAQVSDPTVVKNQAARSKVWKYFGFPQDSSGAVDKSRVICTLCDAKDGFRYNRNRNTTNLVSHLERHHKAEYAEYIKCSGKDTGTGDGQPTLQATLSRSQYLPTSSEHHKQLTVAVTKYIAMDMQPISAVEDRGFRQLMAVAEPRFKVPSRTYFSKITMPSLYSRKRERVEAELSDFEYCCFTTDLWTAQHQNHSYISLTCHFIDKEWQFQSRCLQTNNIADILKSLLQEWKIEGKVSGATTDNGQNVVNAITQMGVFHLPCMGHTMQLSVKRGLEVRSVSHALGSARRVVSHFHKSPKATYKLREKQSLLGLKHSALKADCITRWGSTYEMLEILLEQQQAVCAALLESTKRDDRYLMPSSNDFTVIEELVEILEPFRDATEVVSGEKYPTISIICPLLYKFLNVTLCEKDDDTSLCKEVKRAIRVDLESRYVSQEVEEKLRLSSYLDPRFKALPFLGEVDRALVRLNAKAELVAMIEPENSQASTSTQSPEATEAPAEHLPPPKKKKLETLLGDIFEQRLPTELPTADDTAEAELRRYEAEDGTSLENNKPLEWWKSRSSSYVYLSKLAKRLLCITATSVPSERLFSSAGNLVSQKRSCLSAENVDKLLFLYENL